ncbi:MAG: hypothetical protein GYA24_20470 [Candidatus Lokiarchaeota archaeon]|nr:hypothetical protein [Candidatus Lokiarchaeota archaeon]
MDERNKKKIGNQGLTAVVFKACSSLGEPLHVSTARYPRVAARHPDLFPCTPLLREEASRRARIANVIMSDPFYQKLP